MMVLKRLIVAGSLALMLAGCSMFNRITGDVDNTVLPGQREEAIPGRKTFPDRPDPAVTRAGSPDTPDTGMPPAAPDDTGCSPDDPACAPPTGNDTFSDPQ
jgi:hypothetical protein